MRHVHSAREARDPLYVISDKLKRSRDAVRKKIHRLGLEVVDGLKTKWTTTSNFELPEELPTIEETLKVLTAALKALEQPGLDQSEVLRLRSIIQGAKIYKELFADFVDYRGIEMKLVEMRTKYEELAKKVQDSAASWHLHACYVSIDCGNRATQPLS